MSAASNIALHWEILEDTALHPRLGGLVAWLITSRDFLNHPAPTLSCCLLSSLLICFLIFLQLRMLKQDQVPTRVALKALMAVVVPTCSLWPSRYIKLARVLRSHIKIPLEVLFKDTVDGVIEFRNPGNDLAELIDSGAAVNEYTICIDIGWMWRIRYLKWWMLVEFKPERMLGLSGWPYCSMATTNSAHLDSLPRPSALASSTLNPVRCLDSLPHGIIPTLDAGHEVTLEFTTFSASLRRLSRSQITSAIPFMISGRRPRPLASVLRQLNASCGSNTVINSILNVSVDYELALHDLYKSLCERQKIQQAMVGVLGFKTRRMEMFLVALEAALVRRGWIERWAIQVTVK